MTADLARAADLTIALIMNAGVSANMVTGIGTITITTIATIAGGAAATGIVTGAVDERLNEHGYIVPGLGDAGDRMFGSSSSVPVSARTH